MIRFILNLFKKKTRRYPMPDRNNIIYKKNDVLHYCIGLILFLLIAMAGKAQPFVIGGAGMTGKYFSAELQAGYRISNSTLSIGYTTIPDNSQPVLFNVRAGYVIAERVHVYAGYVRANRSSNDKMMNSNTWQAGAQYLFCFYDRGSFYIGSSYTGSNGISAHLGMTYNIVCIR